MSTQILAPTVIPKSPVPVAFVYSAAFTYSLDMVILATIQNNGTPNVPCRTLIQLTTDGNNWSTMTDAKKANAGYNAATNASFSLDDYARFGNWTQFRIGFGGGQGDGCTVSAYADGVAFGGGGGGSGTVNPGTTGQLASYPSAGPSVSGIGLAGTLALSGGNLGVAARSIGPSQLATGTASTLLGFDGSGNPSAIAAGANVTISGGTISAAAGGGGSGTVSSGTTAQIAAYTGTGSTVGGLTPAGGAVISGGNVAFNIQTVADHAARDAIASGLRSAGMLVFTQNDNAYWAWDVTSSTWVQAGPFQMQHNGASPVNRGAQNFVDTGNLAWTVTDDPTNDRANISAAVSGFQATISLTTTGTGGAATFTSNTLNIPTPIGLVTAHTFRASDYLTDDASTDLSRTSGVGSGTDQTAAMATMMSAINAAGGGFLDWNVKATGLLVIQGSNVTIWGRGWGRYGIKKPASATDSVIRNAAPILGLAVGTTVSGYTNGQAVSPALALTGLVTLGGWSQTNITIGNMTVHGAANNVADFTTSGTNGPKTGIRMWGVYGLTYDTVQVYDCATFMMHQANIQKFRCTNCELRTPLPIVSSTGNTGSGRDGMHNNGPMFDVLIEGNTISADDDSITAEANDGDTSTLHFPYALPGPQSKFRILHNFFDGSVEGIRMLSSNMPIDDIICDGNHGTVQMGGFVMDTYNKVGAPDQAGNPWPGDGAFGSITVLNHDVQTLQDGLGIGYNWIEANFDKLIFGGTYRPSSPVTKPYMWIYPGCRYNKIKADIQCTEYGSGTVLLQDDGIGNSVSLNSRLLRPSAEAPSNLPSYRKAAGSTLMFNWDGYAEFASNVVEFVPGATCESVVLRGVHKDAGSSVGAVNLGSSGQPVVNLNVAALVSTSPYYGAATAPTNVYPSSFPTWTFPSNRTVLLTDTFTASSLTLLTSHTADSGATWPSGSSNQAGGTSGVTDLKLDTSGLYLAGADSANLSSATMPGGPNFAVEIDYFRTTALASGQGILFPLFVSSPFGTFAVYYALQVQEPGGAAPPTFPGPGICFTKEAVNAPLGLVAPLPPLGVLTRLVVLVTTAGANTTLSCLSSTDFVNFTDLGISATITTPAEPPAVSVYGANGGGSGGWTSTTGPRVKRLVVRTPG